MQLVGGSRQVAFFFEHGFYVYGVYDFGILIAQC